jgi:fumarylpyruvate hydrolase
VSHYLFNPPPPPAVPVRGESALFPLRRIFCVGRNYEAHAREMGVAADRSAPFYFIKDAGAYVPPSHDSHPPGTGNFHYEIGFVVAITAAASACRARRASMFGYACSPT